MRAMPEPEEEFTVSRIFNDQGADQWGQDAFPAQPTAAELGFDDNLSAGDNSGGFSPALDSMQRTLRLEQRRKNVLESGPGFQEPAQQPGRTDGPGEFAPGGYPQQGGHQDRYGQQPEYVDAEFVESEPEYQGYQQQPQPPQQPYQQECYYAEPGYGQATRQDQYGQQNYYGEQQQPQPQQYAEYQQYQQGYQEPARFDGFSPRTAERAGGHPYPEQARRCRPRPSRRRPRSLRLPRLPRLPRSPTGSRTCSVPACRSAAPASSWPPVAPGRAPGRSVPRTAASSRTGSPVPRTPPAWRATTRAATWCPGWVPPVPPDRPPLPGRAPTTTAGSAPNSCASRRRWGDRCRSAAPGAQAEPGAR